MGDMGDLTSEKGLRGGVEDLALQLQRDVDEVARHASMGEGEPDALARCVVLLRELARWPGVLELVAALGKQRKEVRRG